MSKKKTVYRKSLLPSLNPYNVIDECKNREDWFSAFTNSVSYFEHYGYWAIKLYCTRNNIKLTKKAIDSLKNLGAVNVILLLRILDAIDDDAYSNMKKIIEERNKLVHPGRKGITYRDRKKKDNAIRLLNQAKESIKRIRGTIRSKLKEGIDYE